MHGSIIAITLLTVCGSAHAAFREHPPASLHLIERARPASPTSRQPSMLARLQPAETTTPPPMVSVPGGEAPDDVAAPAPSTSPSSSPGPGGEAMAYDPHAGSVVPGEVGVGALLVLATDLVSAAALVGIILAAGTNNDSVGTLATLVAGIIGVGIFNLVVTPLAAALGAYMMAPKDGNNGLLGAILGAYVAQFAVSLVGGAIYLGTLAIVGLSGGVSANGTPGAVATIASGLLTLLLTGLHLVGLPLGASFGIHWGTGRPGKSLAAHPRRPVILATRPHETFADVLFTRPGTLVSVPF